MSYLSQYPPEYTSIYVKATTYHADGYYPHFSTNPANSLIGSFATSWLTLHYALTNQRFHIDLGSSKIIERIYYENSHTSGNLTNGGVKNFTFWGSNSATAFAELTYATDTDWTQLSTDVSQLVEHVASNVTDPQFVLVTNTTAYRYYAFKFADGWGNVDNIGIRRIELQIDTTKEVFNNVLFSLNKNIIISKNIYLSLSKYSISGQVSLGGSGVSGATVRLINSTDGTYISSTTTDSNGDYIFYSITSGKKYHVIVEYTSGETKYNTKSFWYIDPKVN